MAKLSKKKIDFVAIQVADGGYIVDVERYSDRKQIFTDLGELLHYLEEVLDNG